MSKSMVRFMRWSAAGACAAALVVAADGAISIDGVQAAEVSKRTAVSSNGSGTNAAASIAAKPAIPAAKPVIPTAKLTAEASRFYSYKKDGASYFAISLQPSATAAPMVEAHDIVVMFDTSASQTGHYREKGLEILRTLLSGLGDKDRVHLVSVDVNSVPMTKTFVPVRGAEMTAALAELGKRVPLGSTDMVEALGSAAKHYSGDVTAPRAAIYIGDGVNNAGMTGDDLRQTIVALRAAQVSVSSYAIGPQLNNSLLAALANQTGGMLVVDAENNSGKDAGMYLSRVAREPVIWARSNGLPESLTEVYPAKMPPLRTDRDTVLVGRGSVDKPFAVELVGESAGKPITLNWNIEPQADNDENAYLASLVESAQADGGDGLPTVGTEGLLEARRMVNHGARNLAQLGHQAAASGNRKQAKQLANEAIRRDPNNQLAQDLRNVIDRPDAMNVAAPAVANGVAPAAGDLRLVKRQPVIEQAVGPASGGFVDEVTNQRDLIGQVIGQEVTTELTRARDRMAVDPLGVQQDLKLLLDKVEQAPEINANLRAQLHDRLVGAIREASRRTEEFEVRQLEALQRLQAAEVIRSTTEAIISREQRVKQLIERFNSLLAERRYQDAEFDGSRVALELMPNSPVTSNAVIVGRTIGYTAQSALFRDKHQKAVVDVLAQVDQANIPFPDDPPIVYPAADVWMDLTRRRVKYKAVDLSRSGSSEEKIYTALQQTTEFGFDDTPLKDAIEVIKDRHGIEIQFDDKALLDAAVASDTPVTRHVSGISLRSALRLLLRPLQLTYVVRDEVLSITTQADADARLVVKVYPVADLVLPISSGGGINPFQLGGGNQGGPGAFQGGGGGQGGFGGGGGGQGGFGGGGGGGGFGGGGQFNVLDDNDAMTPAVAPMGGAFAVPDTNVAAKPSDLKLSKKGATVTTPVAKSASKPAAVKTAAAAKAEINDDDNTPLLGAYEEPTAKKAPAFRVELKLTAGTDRDAAWDAYFANLGETSGIDKLSNDRQRLSKSYELNAAVREASRLLMREHKFSDVSAMIRGALRNGYAQPWMYEAMGLAMQADNQPKAEIERALMSSVDFATSGNELMHAALYMSRIGLEQRSMKLFKLAAALEPNRYEPYMHGLMLAQRMDDLASIRWACVGVLSRAWPKDKTEVFDTARHLAQATLERLKKEKRGADAAGFETAMNDALTRDLLVRVSWTGDADIDLVVEEPTGTVCSLRNPRTIAGGVMLGGSSAGKKSDGLGHSEDYVVPQGFSGDYKVLVRPIWGRVTAGKVTVDLYSHYGTKQSEHIRRQIPVGDKDSLVIFKLNDGRRKDPLDQVQVAVAADGQREIGRAILAQQLSSMSDSGAMRDLAIARQQANDRGIPFFRNGAVGFQPVISTLPEGTNMSAIAVVSADRRYVRITPTPLFSSIPEVSTFNFASGTGGTGVGGTNNGGGVGNNGGGGGNNGGGNNGGGGVF